MPEIQYTCGEILSDALIEIGALAPGDVLDGETGQWAFRKFNDLIDTWQALERYVYGYQFNLYTLVAGLSPHTIGPADSTPAPTFSTGTQPRPVKISGAATILASSGQKVDSPIITIRDADWWRQQQTKEIQTNVPTDLYYDAGSPLGSLYFWPVPNAAVQVRLQFWQTVSQFESITDPIGGAGGPGTLPQGYRNALKLTLAEMLCPGAKITASPELVKNGIQARAAIFGNNSGSPRISTRDAGVPQAGRSGRGDFNWMTGGRPGGPAE